MCPKTTFFCDYVRKETLKSFARVFFNFQPSYKLSQHCLIMILFARSIIVTWFSCNNIFNNTIEVKEYIAISSTRFFGPTSFRASNLTKKDKRKKCTTTYHIIDTPLVLKLPKQTLDSLIYPPKIILDNNTNKQLLILPKVMLHNPTCNIKEITNFLYYFRWQFAFTRIFVSPN